MEPYYNPKLGLDLGQRHATVLSGSEQHWVALLCLEGGFDMPVSLFPAPNWLHATLSEMAT